VPQEAFVFRSHAPRAVVAALTAVVLIVGLMASATSAAPKPKPTPTPVPTPSPTPTPTPIPNSDNRVVYFGWPATDGDRHLGVSEVTTGNIFVIDVIARSDDNQVLTHPVLALGTAVQPGGPDANSLPANASILSVERSGVGCLPGKEVQTTTSYKCELPNFALGDSTTLHVTLRAGDTPVNNDIIWATFKVAEKVSDVGANQNTAFASSQINIQQTNSNANASFKTGDSAFALSTGDQTLVKKDTMNTTVTVPGDTGVGAISIAEIDCSTEPTLSPCTGQIATVHVRNGAPQSPYLEWTLRITGNLPSPTTIYHQLDGATDWVAITESCDADTTTDCIFSVVKNGNTTEVVFRTIGNGRVRG
jgi:hypothetical protein